MSLHEDIIFADPVLYRVFFDERRFAPIPGRAAIVAIALNDITKLKLAFQKATSVEYCERIARQIRREYFMVRRHCDGYFYDKMQRVARDNCEHVCAFRHRNDAAVFDVDYRARSAYRHRYAHRPNTPSRTRPRRA